MIFKNKVLAFTHLVLTVEIENSLNYFKLKISKMFSSEFGKDKKIFQSEFKRY